METKETISLIIQIVTLLGIIFAIYRYFRTPDEKAASEIKVMKEACRLKHQYIDENLVIIKENHLKHIEEDIKRLTISQERIFTILEERLPKKI